jgi:hypothetical protein
MVGLTGCFDSDEDSGGGDDTTTFDSGGGLDSTAFDSGLGDNDTKAACQIGTTALGLILEGVTRGRRTHEIGEAVSSKLGGEVLSAGCVVGVKTLINHPKRPVSFEWTHSGQTETLDVSGQDLLDQLFPTRPKCSDWLYEALIQSCIKGAIPPP